MTLNEAPWDRIVRVLVGVVLIAIVFVGPKTALGWIGVIPLLTGLVGFCPLYRLFGFATAHHDDGAGHAPG